MVKRVVMDFLEVREAENAGIKELPVSGGQNENRVISPYALCFKQIRFVTESRANKIT